MSGHLKNLLAIGRAIKNGNLARRMSHIPGVEENWRNANQFRREFGFFKNQFKAHERAMLHIAEWIYGGYEEAKEALGDRAFAGWGKKCGKDCFDLLDKGSRVILREQKEKIESVNTKLSRELNKMTSYDKDHQQMMAQWNRLAVTSFNFSK